MGRTQETFGKKEKDKKRIKKRNEKMEKREERKANAKAGQPLEEMLAYVDEYGNITDTPPDPAKKKAAKEQDMQNIQIGVPRLEDREQEDPTRTGSVTFFNDSKGYGFIRDQQSQQSIFVHVNALNGLQLREGDKVTFETEMGQKGPMAVRVKMAGATPPPVANPLAVSSAPAADAKDVGTEPAA